MYLDLLKNYVDPIMEKMTIIMNKLRFHQGKVILSESWIDGLEREPREIPGLGSIRLLLEGSFKE